MKIVVIGGTGLIGSKVVAKLSERRTRGVPPSPNSGVNTSPAKGSPTRSRRRRSSSTCRTRRRSRSRRASSSSRSRRATSSTPRGRPAWGITSRCRSSARERLPDSGYLRAKLAQEKLIKESAIPYSIVHATQFFEFVKRIADEATDGNTVRLPPVLIQPMAADDVATAVGSRCT